MVLFAEQKLLRCSSCGRSFVVQYDCRPAWAGATEGAVAPRWVACPNPVCRQPSQVTVPLVAYPLLAKPIPAGLYGRGGEPVIQREWVLVPVRVTTVRPHLAREIRQAATLVSLAQLAWQWWPVLAWYSA